MRKNSITLLVVGALLLAVCATFIRKESPSNIEQKDAAHAASLPSLLSIPKLSVKAPVEAVGVTPEGNMATPKATQNVGWYKFGALPGEMGSAVLAGHLDDPFGLPAVFSKLSTLSEGDDIYLSMEDGKKLHFKVTGQKIYDYNADTSEVFHSTEGSHLNLITCNGSWLKNAQSYNKRLVVFTELVSF